MSVPGTVTYAAPAPMTYAAPAAMTYAAPAGVTYTAAPATQTYQATTEPAETAPVTYTAPSPTVSTIQTRPGVIATAAPSIVVSRALPVAAKAVNEGNVVGVYDVSREDLIAQGRLLVNEPVDKPTVTTRAIDTTHMQPQQFVGLSPQPVTYMAQADAVTEEQAAGGGVVYAAPAPVTYMQAPTTMTYGGPTPVTYVS